MATRGPLGARRVAVLVWGLALAAWTGLPFVHAFINGYDPYDIDSSGIEEAFLPGAFLVVGVLAGVGALTRRRFVGWTLVAAVPLVLGLAAWVNVRAGGAWFDPPWRPLITGLLVALPAALLLVGGRASRARSPRPPARSPRRSAR